MAQLLILALSTTDLIVAQIKHREAPVQSSTRTRIINPVEPHIFITPVRRDNLPCLNKFWRQTLSDLL